MIQTLAIGSDHGGLQLKEEIKAYLSEKYSGLVVKDLGTHNQDSVDYPDFARSVVESVLHHEADSGIIVCGTGIGVSIMANRFQGIRAAVVHDDFTATMAKAHNNANVLCLGGRTTSSEQAFSCIKKWLETEFEGGRHQNRLAKLDQ